MPYFVAAYVLIAVVGFTVFAMRERSKDKRRKLNNAAEKIVREDLLLYSLKNPYSETGRCEIPSSRRAMIALRIKAGGKKQEFVFDPAKQVNIGRGDRNQIIIHDPAVSELHACIYIADRKVCVYNASNSRGVTVQRSSGRRVLAPGQSAALKNGDVIRLGGYKLFVNLFIFDINYK